MVFRKISYEMGLHWVAGGYVSGHGGTHAEELGHAPGGTSRTKNTSHLTCDTGSPAGVVRRNYVLVGNNIIRCLRRLCGRTAATMIQQHCNCSRI